MGELSWLILTFILDGRTRFVCTLLTWAFLFWEMTFMGAL